ncbi:RCC1 domain-containing protein [Clostridioides difficile]|uniref:RCC1 domain-containing protein n=1 Tax=Clostridioides difficile TaxID=1496 RepID=UPI000F60AAA5|nr:chromosome condensation regulator [Clostridioides difficile]MCJ0309686.1 chromosome condensation regulator [Clostridioides difficile]MCJ0377303.1 chromosome condensation regulator [Clostridioides difficile]MCJ0409335.1 chromosome condensation regulator [Clostridioides difficile]MDB0413154.1 chromosome condensation regulator [Clostridioides difficile]MDB2944429.1 chromosome condensation regulator [Clostridioides difficile]
MKQNKLLQRGAYFNDKNILIDDFDKRYNDYDFVEFFTGISNSTFGLKSDGNLYACGDNTGFQLGLGKDSSERRMFSKVKIDNVKYVSCGSKHSVAVTKDGFAYGAGTSNVGQLGVIESTVYYEFTKLPIDDVKTVACGYDFTFVLKNDGTLYSAGLNSSGQLGLGDTNNRATFTKVNIDSVKDVVTYNQSVFIIKMDGTAHACGLNSNGQLGINSTLNKSVFNKIEGMDNVKQIACGSSHTILIKNDGTMYTTGYNGVGQLGTGNNNNSIVFTLSSINNVKYASCGNNHTMILKYDNTLFSTGQNNYGQLANANKDVASRNTFVKVNVENIKDIKCGSQFNFLINGSKEIFVSGCNLAGQLGSFFHTTFLYEFSKVQSSNLDNYSGLLVNDDYLYVTKDNSEFLNVKLSDNFQDYKKIELTDNNMFIVMNDGTLYACGLNNYGQLGLGDTVNRSVMTKVDIDNVLDIKGSGNSTFVLKNNGTLYSCGLNSNGQLGLRDEVNRNIFTKIEIENVKDFCVESDYVIALNHSKEVYGWGYSANSNIERTSNYPYKQNITGIEKIATYYRSVYMINSEGRLYVSGYNDYYQLGTGGNNSSTNRTIVSNCRTYSTSSSSGGLRELPKITNVFPFEKGCAIIDENGYVYLTGYHRYVATSNNSPSISDYSRYGYFIENTTSNYNNYFIQENSFNGIEKVIGTSNNILYFKKGSTYVTGYPKTFGSSATGYKSYTTISSEYSNLGSIFIITSSSSKLYGHGIANNGEFGNITNLDGVSSYDTGLKDIKDIIVKNNTVVIVDKNNNIYVTGTNQFNKLGIGEYNNQPIRKFTNITEQSNSFIFMDDIKEITTSRNTMFIVKNDGTAYATGNNSSGQLGLGDTINRNKFTQINLDNIKKISTSIDGNTTFAIRNDGTLYSTGLNTKGQLGLGDIVNRNTFTKVNIQNVRDVVLGTTHSHAIKDDNTLYSCGENTHGQLGLGSESNHPDVLTFTVNNITNVRDVYCSDTTTFIVKDTNIAYCCGYNNNSQLGMGNTTDQYSFIKCMENVKEVIPNEINTYIITIYNTAYSTGLNTDYCLGLNSNSNQSSFSEIPISNVVKVAPNRNNAVLLLTSEGDVYTAGKCSNGSGTGSETPEKIKKIASKAKDIGMNYRCGHYVSDNGDLYGTGFNNNGQLGVGDVTKRDTFIKTNTRVKKILPLEYANIAIKDTNDIYICGLNNYGQLGVGSRYDSRNNDNRIFNYKHMNFVMGDLTSIKNRHNFILLNNKIVIPTTKDIDYGLVLGNLYKGDLYTELPYEDIKEVSISKTHIIILLNDGTMYGCGTNYHGELLQDLSINQVDEFVQINVSDVKHVSCGDNFTYFIKSDDSLWSIGKNSEYQLGIGHNNPVTELQRITTISSCKEVHCGKNYTLVVTTGNELFVQGYNDKGALGLGSDSENTIIKFFTKALTDIREIKSYGSDHILVLKNDNSVWVTGKNRDVYKIEQPVEFLKEFTIIPISEDVNTVKDVLATDNTLYIISEVGTTNAAIEITEKSISSIKIKIQDPNKDISRIEMLINGESVKSVSDLITEKISFEVPPDKIKIGENKILFRAYCKGDDLYASLFIFKESTGNSIIKDSYVMIGNRMYKVVNTTSNEQDITITLDRGLEEDLNLGDPIYQLINKTKVQVKINKSDLFKDMKLVEIKKSDSSYQEIYELEEANIKSAQPKIIVEKGDKWTAIKRPSMIFRYDAENNEPQA